MVTYTERPAAMAAFLGRTGPIAQHIHAIGQTTLSLAQRKADAKLHVRTGLYHGGFRIDDRMVSRGPQTSVTNTAPHALIIEKGSEPHVITPRRTGGMLRFTVGGRTVYARKVNHPGTRPMGILTESLAEAVRRSS